MVEHMRLLRIDNASECGARCIGAACIQSSGCHQPPCALCISVYTMLYRCIIHTHIHTKHSALPISFRFLKFIYLLFPPATINTRLKCQQLIASEDILFCIFLCKSDHVTKRVFHFVACCGAKFLVWSRCECE